MSELAGASWLGGWDEPGVLSIVLIAAGAPGSGLFVYSGPPAAGNLIGSIAAANGTDLFGNAYLAGFTSYLTVAGNAKLLSSCLPVRSCGARRPRMRGRTRSIRRSSRLRMRWAMTR